MPTRACTATSWASSSVRRCVVENKTGAGAVIGIDAVVKSPPDGYTLLVTTTGTVMQNRVLYTKLPYNLDKDLTPIAVFPSGPLVVGVAPNVPANNLKEFVAWAKGKDLSMGSYAPGSYPHMLADQFTRSYGLKMLAVQYRGESPMWVDVADQPTADRRRQLPGLQHRRVARRASRSA